MLVKINFKFLIPALVLIAIVGAMFTGNLQSIIKFADPLNEIFFTLIAALMASMLLIGSFESVKQNK